MDEDDLLDYGDVDPLEDVIERSRKRAAQFDAWLQRLRDQDIAFAEASLLQPADFSEWQSAVYLLTGNDQVWGEVGAAVMREGSMAPVTAALESHERGWSSSQRAVMVWAVHLWNVLPDQVRFPYEFELANFSRWIAALHLRQHISPELTL